MKFPKRCISRGLIAGFETSELIFPGVIFSRVNRSEREGCANARQLDCGYLAHSKKKQCVTSSLSIYLQEVLLKIITSIKVKENIGKYRSVSVIQTFYNLT